MTTGRAAAVLTLSRRRAGLSQRALSERSGVAQSTISLVESGKVEPSVPVLERLVEACGAELVVETVPRDGRWSAAAAAEVAARWNAHGDEDSAVRAGIQLRDDLAAASAVRVAELSSDAPASTGNAKVDAMIAAVVDEACRRRRIPPPGWVLEEDRRLSQPSALWDMPVETARRDVRRTPRAFLAHGLIASQRDLASA